MRAVEVPIERMPVSQIKWNLWYLNQADNLDFYEQEVIGGSFAKCLKFSINSLKTGLPISKVNQ